ncbi:MAG: beta-N-acetylhexosaminidase [Myxococcota bacterium]
MTKLIVGFDGKHPPREVAALASRGLLAGVCLFARNFESSDELRALVREVVALFPDGPPPLIAVDQEGGPVQRLKAPRTPEVATVAAMGELAATTDPAGFERLGAAMGADLRAFGINVDFAPVLDVDTNPANPVIGKRAFGKTPEDVIARALPFARGLRSAGVMPCGKHFPGHGDTVSDSHVSLPRLAHRPERLAAIELPPFAAAVRAGFPLIMTAHVVFEALDAERPATLSPRVVPTILRRAWGYDGVVVSDDLDMAAVKGAFDLNAIARGLGAAEVDLALVCLDLAFAEELAQRLAPSARAAERVARLRQALSFPTRTA